MRVDHCCLDMRVAKQFLHRADVAARLQQMRGEAVPQGMWSHPLANVRRYRAAPDGLLKGGVLHMMPPSDARTRVNGRLP